MQRRKPDLIVPIRDRRQHKRYLTLRNARNALAVLAVLFLAITIRSELQPRHRDGFGRLLERELPKVETSAPAEVVQEAPPPVADQSAPDPMLVAPAQREQWLYADGSTAPAPGTIEPVPAVNATAIPRDADSRFVIVGGPEGVSVVEQKRRRQTLRGGFGR